MKRRGKEGREDEIKYTWRTKGEGEKKKESEHEFYSFMFQLHTDIQSLVQKNKNNPDSRLAIFISDTS